MTTGIIERLIDAGYQVCVIDPEGDYQTMKDALMLGASENGPKPEEILNALENSERSVVANLIAVPHEHRPAFFATLLTRIRDLRSQTGLPHWIIVDEAHLIPAERHAEAMIMPKNLCNVLMVTVHTENVEPAVLSHVDILLATGNSPAEAFREFTGLTGSSVPQLPGPQLQRGEAFL